MLKCYCEISLASQNFDYYVLITTISSIFWLHSSLLSFCAKTISTFNTKFANVSLRISRFHNLPFSYLLLMLIILSQTFHCTYKIPFHPKEAKKGRGKWWLGWGGKHLTKAWTLICGIKLSLSSFLFCSVSFLPLLVHIVSA